MHKYKIIISALFFNNLLSIVIIRSVQKFLPIWMSLHMH